jgi:drug/metabolite transporter (DMT)-like permease
MKNLSNQQRGSFLTFIAVMLITPDSIFIRLSNIETWGMLFYRGAIPFVVVLIGLISFYKKNLFKALVSIGYPGIFYVISFSICNITFIISIQNTNVANTLVMIAMAPILSAILGSIFLKEVPDRKTWIAIIITLISVTYIFYDSIEMGNFYGDLFGIITAFGLACNAVIARYAKNRDLVPSAVIGKLCVAIFAFFFVDTFSLIGTDLIIVPLMCVMCVAIPFVLVTIAPRFIPAEEVNLFFLLETIIGPFWVWMVIKEQPSIETIQGGVVIILTIAIHSFFKLKKS